LPRCGPEEFDRSGTRGTSELQRQASVSRARRGPPSQPPGRFVLPVPYPKTAYALRRANCNPTTLPEVSPAADSEVKRKPAAHRPFVEVQAMLVTNRIPVTG